MNLSKTDISSVYRAGPTGVLLRALSIPNVKTGRPGHGPNGHFENETGFFPEFLRELTVCVESAVSFLC